MQTLTKTVEVFITVDGKEFVDFEEASAYEEQVIALRQRRDSIKYFELVYSPDLTEGRGYSSLLHIAVETADFIGYTYYIDQLLRALTKPVEYVQGVSPIAGYACVEISEEQYLNPDAFHQLGSYKYYASRIFLSNNVGIEGYPSPCPLNITSEFEEYIHKGKRE